MRKLILVAVVLQLAVIIIESNAKEEPKYKFGDLISFIRIHEGTGKTFKHFAVYVGTRNLEGKTAEQDIFHRIGNRRGVTGLNCRFGRLADETGERKVENELDGEKTLFGTTINKGTDQEIADRIKVLRTVAGCGKYNVAFNNCEHLATAVRYGYEVTKQKGTDAGNLCLLNQPQKCARLNKLVERMRQNAENENECWQDPNAVC